MDLRLWISDNANIVIENSYTSNQYAFKVTEDPNLVLGDVTSLSENDAVFPIETKAVSTLKSD